MVDAAVCIKDGRKGPTCIRIPDAHTACTLGWRLRRDPLDQMRVLPGAERLAKVISRPWRVRHQRRHGLSRVRVPNPEAPVETDRQDAAPVDKESRLHHTVAVPQDGSERLAGEAVPDPRPTSCHNVDAFIPLEMAADQNAA